MGAKLQCWDTTTIITPTLTLKIEALPSDEDDDNELNVCNDTIYVQSQFHEDRRSRKRGLSIAINHQTYLQHRPQLHEMNDVQKSTKEL